jgi:lipopolysaccharide transport system ATP-binding protein
VGDAAFQRKCLGKMKDVSTNEGRTVLFVSHNMGVILQLCERAILLEQGRMIANDRSTLVVPAYLSASQTIESEATFDIARGRDAQITSVHLVDDRSRANVRTWPHTRPFSIVISYIVSRWPKGAYVCVDVFNEQDARLIWSSDVNDVDEMLRSRKPGTYEASIEVPAMVLAPGRYFFTVAIYHPGAKAVIDAKRKAIAIDITDGGSLASKIGIMPGSLTSVPLSWKTRRREHHA